MIKKTLQPTNDVYLQFTEEELSSIGAKPGDKFSVKHNDDGSIELRPYVKMEIDIADWSREVLEMVVTKSVEDDISVNDVVNNLLKQALEEDTISTTRKDSVLLNEAGNIDPTITNSDTSICSNEA